MFERFGAAKFLSAILTIIALIGIGVGGIYIFWGIGRFGAIAVLQAVPVIAGSCLILLVAQLVRAQIATAEQTANMAAQMRKLIEVTERLGKEAAAQR